MCSPESFDLVRPRDLEGVVHEPTSGSRADKGRGHAEKTYLTFAFNAKVEIQQTFIAARGCEDVHFDVRLA